MRRIPDVLDRGEVTKLLAVPNQRYLSGLRDYCVMSMMLSAGLRASEVLGLKWKDVDLTKGKLKVRQGKGKKDRVLWFNGDLQVRLQKWRERCPGGSEFVFSTKDGKRQHDSALRAMVKRRGVKTGIGKDVHPHMLRHTFGTEFYRQTKDIRMVQKALGHANVATTMIYTHIVDDDLEEGLKALKW